MDGYCARIEELGGVDLQCCRLGADASMGDQEGEGLTIGVPRQIQEEEVCVDSGPRCSDQGFHWLR